MSKSFLVLFFKKELLSFFLLIAFCTAGPFAWPLDPAAIDVNQSLSSPSLAHPIGTDALGRDELARLMQGGAETLSVAVPAALLAFVLGTAYGLVAGVAPTLVARLLLRLLDALLALPSLVVLLCGAALLKQGAVTVALLIGLTAWPSLARQVRGEIVALQARDFIAAARQLGAGPGHLARVHFLPHVGRLLVVNATFLVGDSILALSSLSFLGLGVPPPAASWGSMLQSGLGLVDLGAWWLILPPGLLIAASLFAAAAAGRAILGMAKEEAVLF